MEVHRQQQYDQQQQPSPQETTTQLHSRRKSNSNRCTGTDDNPRDRPGAPLVAAPLQSPSPAAAPADDDSTMTRSSFVTTTIRSVLVGMMALLMCIVFASNSSNSSSFHTAISTSFERESVADPMGRSKLQHHLRRRATEDDDTRQLSIFADDDRRPVSDPSLYPYSAIGLLRWSEDLSCTASLIADQFIVTAAECALDAEGNVRESTFAKPRFLPGFAFPTTGATVSADVEANAEIALVDKVHKQSDFWKKWTQNTYVILELDSPIGETHGVLQLPSLSDLDQSEGKAEVQLAGYDDQALDLTKASMQYAKCTCLFPSEFNGPQYMLLHDCDTSAVGSPGSPLLVRYTSMETYIIGIHSNAVGGGATAEEATTTTIPEFTQDVANRGVLGPFIQKHLKSLVAAPSSDAKSDASSSDSSTNSKPSSSSSSRSNADSTNTDAREEEGASAAASSSGDDALVSGSAVSRNGEPRSEHERITPAAAYICIAFVCLAWACILFIAVRHVRRGQGEGE